MVSLVTILVHDSDEEKQAIVRRNLTQQASPHPIAVQRSQYRHTQAPPTVMNSTARSYPPLDYAPNTGEQIDTPSPLAPKLVLHDELVNSTHNLATTHSPEAEKDPMLWPDSIYYAPAPLEQARGVQPLTSSNVYHPNKRVHGEEPKGIELYVPRRDPSAYRPHIESPSSRPSSQYLYAPSSTNRHRYPPEPQTRPPRTKWGYTSRADLGSYQAYSPPRPSAPSRFHPGLPYPRYR
jgi:hypothetical protein